MRRFVTFEGCEGVGKSTQLKLLKEYLERTGQKALFTREPGGTPLAERIREILLDPALPLTALSEAYLFAAARASHVEEVIRPALERGELVISDRFLHSSLAYQGEARELGFEAVYRLNEAAIGDCIPDCTIFLDQDPAHSWRKRKGKRVENDRLEAENEAFHLAVYRGFLKLAERSPKIVRIVPQEDKNATHLSILDALRKRGMIE